MHKSRAIAVILALAAAVTILPFMSTNASALTVRPGSALPQVTLVDAAGKPVELAKLIKGKTVLLVYWSVTCDHCVKDVPSILRDYNLKKQDYSLVLVAGDSGRMLKVAKAFIKKQRLGTSVALYDPERSRRFALGDTLGLQYTPTIIVVCREGRMVRIFEGNPGLTEVKRVIKQALVGRYCSTQR